ncbi:MAG: ribosomal protein S18-alanine N-acetyltransferase [Dehalococcoidia bacterium]|nr:ribosomal protein S18-alanine N-acetyltransferase [Dehalococcoidia bacterium]
MATADIPAVMAIEHAAYDSGWPPTAFERELTTNAMARYIVLERHGGGAPGIIGFAGMWLMVDQAHVVTVAVNPAERRTGYGRLLLHALLDLAIRDAATDATLEVRVSNEAARALYRAYGFWEVGERKRYYSNGEDAVIMTTEGFDTPAFRDKYTHLEHQLAARFPDTAPRTP